MALAAKQRIGYIDWMRGLACLLMFQTHCYDSWLSPVARNTSSAALSFFGGNFVRAGDESHAAKRSVRKSNRGHHDSARRGDFRTGLVISRAGIRAGLSERAVERSAARGHFEHHRRVHNADGHRLPVR